MGAQVFKKLKYNSRLVGFWRVLAVPLGGLFWFWFWLVRATSHIKLTGEGLEHRGAAIYVNWHQHLPFLISHHGEQGRWMLVSRAPYMEPIARWCLGSGLSLIRGASGEDGKATLPLLAEQLKKGESIVLAVDGPAGPPWRSKRGCVDLARMTGVPIIPVAFRCQRGKPNRKRWDQLLAPKFFDTIEVKYGRPFLIGSEVTLDTALELVNTALKSVDQK